MPPPSPEARTALVVAHSSHELRVLGWLEQARPRVFIMTDGSGRSGQARLSATRRVLDQMGAQPGSIFGRITDLELYAGILKQDFDFFITLCDELADSPVRERIDCVVGDAIEGYSSAHDICRLLINAAVDIASRRDNRYISNLDSRCGTTGRIFRHDRRRSDMDSSR